jgi:hypothetical protein
MTEYEKRCRRKIERLRSQWTRTGWARFKSMAIRLRHQTILGVSSKMWRKYLNEHRS